MDASHQVPWTYAPSGSVNDSNVVETLQDIEAVVLHYLQVFCLTLIGILLALPHHISGILLRYPETTICLQMKIPISQFKGSYCWRKWG